MPCEHMRANVNGPSPVNKQQIMHTLTARFSLVVKQCAPLCNFSVKHACSNNSVTNVGALAPTLAGRIQVAEARPFIAAISGPYEPVRRVYKALGRFERTPGPLRVRIHGAVLLLVRHEAGEEIHGQREDDGGILLGGNGIQCLKVAQLQGGRA